MELKDEYNKPTALQRITMGRMKKAGGMASEIYDVYEAEAFLRKVQNVAYNAKKQIRPGTK